MQQFEYAVRIARADGRFSVHCRDFPELNATADDHAGALDLAAAHMDAIFVTYMQAGKVLPLPSTPREGESLVSPKGAETIAKAALWAAMREAGISKVQLAKRLDVDEKEVRRLLDPHYKSKLPKITHAIELLGRKLRVRLELA